MSPATSIEPNDVCDPWLSVDGLLVVFAEVLLDFGCEAVDAGVFFVFRLFELTNVATQFFVGADSFVDLTLVELRRAVEIGRLDRETQHFGDVFDQSQCRLRRGEVPHVVGNGSPQ